MEFEIRSDREKTPGRRGLPEERAEYLRLVQQGVGRREACRIVGVNQRTGTRWSNGRNASGKDKAAPPLKPVAVPPLKESPHYLREAERLHIADRLREGASLRAIALELRRSPSTISREVRRNRLPEEDRYRPHLAQARAAARRPRPKSGKLALNRELREVVQGWLDVRWSPEQISQSLRVTFPDRPEMRVCPETIYQAIYIPARGELRREHISALRTGRARRRPRRSVQRRQPRYGAPMVMIGARPAEVEDRVVPGHWEGDLIIGKGLMSQIGTLVERASRYVVLVPLPFDRTAETVCAALTATIETLPESLRRSLTWDQGSEMGLHHRFSSSTGMPVYFCEPHSPWQRGSNENANGLLRQYFPKGTDLAVHSAAQLEAVAAELNARPRKTLGWETPAERLAKLLASAS